MIRLRTQKLLSGVSALAALMTFGAAGGAQAAGTTVSGPGSVDPINTQTDTTLSTRDFVTIDGNAHVGVDGSGRSFYNPRTTPGLITIGGFSTSGLVINDSTLEGSIVNGGVISSTSGDAVNIFNSVIQGGLTNTGSIFSIPPALGSADDGIQIDNTDFFGGIHNTLDAEIRAYDDAINILSGTTFEGGITNAGLIASTSSASGSGTGGTGNGIRIASGVSFSGGITNTVNGEIRGGGSSSSLAAILVNGDSFTGGISNSGLIKGQGFAGDGIDITGVSFAGGITNELDGVIITTGSQGNAIEIEGDYFSGGIVNHGLIDGQQSSAHAISVSGLTFEGGISNSGSIYSDSSAAISVSGTQFSGGIQNGGEIVSNSGTAIEVSNGSFAGGITNEEGGLIQGSDDAISVTSGVSFSGGITNAGLIQSTSSDNAIDINADLFTGGIVNSGSIIAQSGFTFQVAAINIRGTSFVGGISNSGLIEGGSSSGAIDITGTSFSGGIQNSGSIIGDGNNAIYFGSGSFTDGITNEEGGLINSTSNAIELVGATFTGGISNAGIIGGTTSGNADIAIHVGTAFQGGITNDETGVIQGSTNAILVNGTSFAGGIHNAGLIKSTDPTSSNLAIAITAGSFSGGIENTGTISANETVIGISGTSFTGGISNGGLIESTGNDGTAIAFSSGSFTGGISNSGTILGGDIAINLSGATFDGGITNDGSIQSDGSQATAIVISSASFTGGITNNAGGVIQAGTESGTATAIVLNGSSFSGGIVNDGLIQGGTSSGMGVNAGAASFAGGILNSGTIQAAETGLYIHGNSFTGGLNNDGGIIQSTGSGYGVEITSTSFSGGVTNSGLIKGVPGTTNNGTGLLILSNTFSGGIDNSGTISGDDPGLVVNVTSFSGGVSNSGLIEGTGVSADGANLSGTTFSGGFVNSGSITGWEEGVDITFTNFNGGFTNTSSGEITGLRGARLGGTNFHGDVLNAGLIDGGEGEGLRLEMTLLAGNVTNQGEINGSADGLHIDSGTTVTGDVLNSGTITSDIGDGVDVRGHVEGSFSNSGLILGGTESAGLRVAGSIDGNIFNSGSIISAAGLGVGAVNLVPEGQAHELTQTAGLISDGGEGSYAINMDNIYEDTFFANGGVVEGDIYAGGEGNSDDMITQEGTFAWAYGDTGATSLDQFDVNEDGTMILGAYERGDSFSGIVDVVAESMALDGHLYLNDRATVHVTDFAQSATGDVEYFLTADTGVHGQIDVTGPGPVSNADLAGTVSVYADAATFADSKFSGQTTFTYTYVVATNNLTGNFSNAGDINTNSLFFTGEAVDNGDDGIDIVLNRVAFADVLDNDGETENQNAVGGALDTIFSGGEFSGDFQDLIEGLLANGLTAEEIQAIYDELGGAEHAQLQNTTLGLSGLLGTLIGDRLDATLPGLNGGKSASLAFRQFADGTDGKTATDATPPASYGNRGLNTGMSGASVWAKGFGNWTQADGDTEATGYDQNTGGAALGLDFAVASNATLGLAGSWSTTDVTFDTAGDDATVDTWQGGLYGSVGMGRFYLDGSATYSSHDLSVNRLVDLPDPASPFVASSNYNATAWSLNGEFGSIFRLGRMDLQPSAGLSYTSLSTDAFTETGDNNAFNLLVQGSDASSFASTLAVRGSGQFMMGRTRVMPDVKLGWRHEFGDDRQTFTAAFEEDPTVPFEIISSKTSADAAIVNAGITAAVTKNLEVFVDLNGQYSGDVTTSNAGGGVRFTW